MTYPLHGLVPLGGNRLSEGEYHDALLALQSLENTRALYYALAGTETDGTPAAPAGGHAHDTGSTELHWLQVGSWRTYTLFQSDNRYGARVVNETSATPIALIPFVLPPGSTTVTPRAMIQIPTAVTLTLLYEFFIPSGLNAAAAASVTLSQLGIFSHNTTATGQPDWIEGSDVDLSGLGQTDSRRIVYLLVSASVNSGSADVAQIQLGLIDESSAPASVALDEALAIAHADLATDDLAALFIDNPSRLRDLIYGVTFPHPRHSRPHDHGEGRGEPLERHLLSLIYGPHVAEGGGATAGGTIGIPILEPAVGVDYTTDEKVLAQQGIFVPGGVDEIKFRVSGYFPGAGTRTATLKVEVRPMSDVGYGPGDNLGQVGTLSFSTSSNYAEATVTLDISALGDIHRDRVYDLTLWQASNPPAASVYRLTSLLAYAGAAPATLPELATHAPVEALTYARILEGQEVSTLLAAKVHRALNQVTYETLGGVPGLETDLSTPDTSDPWKRELSETHKHRGSFDDDSGDRVDDGAVVRSVLWAQAYAAHVAADSGAEASLGTIAPVLGHKIHPSTDTSFFGGRCSIPKGLRAVEIYALIQPGIANQESRLYASFDAAPVNGDPLIQVAARSGPFSAQADGIGSDMILQVLPQDGAAWLTNEQRLGAGLGVWTTDALKSVSDLPSTLSVTNVPRWTQPIRLEIEPAPDAADGYAYDVDLNVFFVMQFGGPALAEDTDTWATSARLLSLLVVPAKDDPTPEPAARNLTLELGTVELPSAPGGGSVGTAGAGLTLTGSTFAVGAGTGITVNADDVAVDTSVIQQKATLTAKGDLYVATASATVARQAVGSNGQVLVADSTQTNGIKWSTPMTAGFASKWNPWTPPGTIHTKGDEFDNSSLDVKWSEWDPATLLTVTEDAWGVKLAHTDNPGATHSLAGIYQAFGADDEWEITTRVTITAPHGDGAFAGLGLLQDPSGAPTTSDALLFTIRSPGASGPDIVGLHRYTDYTTFAASPGSFEWRSTEAYLCLQWKVSTAKYSAWFSSNGIGWNSLLRDQAHGMAAAPGYFGLCVNAFNKIMHARYEFCRVKSGAAGSYYDVFPEPLGG
jgi:hypothetical protein